MGNNFCYQNGAQQANYPQLLLKHSLGGCEVTLTAGSVESEDVECIVKTTDQDYSSIPNKDRPSFIPQHGSCIFVGACKSQKKHIILAVVQEKSSQITSSDKSEEEKQVIYEAVQQSLIMADSRQIKSIALPVFPQKNHTTSATIMLMAIKLCLTEKKIPNISRISVTLNVENEIGQVNSFKWVFQQVFKMGQPATSPSKSYSSSIVSQCDTLPNQQRMSRARSNYQEDTP